MDVTNMSMEEEWLLFLPDLGEKVTIVPVKITGSVTDEND